MTKFLGFAAVLMAALAAMLITPTSSEAGVFLRWRNRYVEPSSPAVDCCSGGSTVAAPGYSATYYPSYNQSYSPTYYQTNPGYNSGYYQSGGGLFSGYYRVGNVIINGRRWGDIGYRYSHGDLIRW